MNLHNNIQEFYDTILVISNKLNISPAIVEKDYYVSLFLKTLSKKVESLIFKGGTSLSKCYKIINRFSEDIDITLDEQYRTQSNKRNLKQEIINVCEELGLQLINSEEIRSRRDYNRYEIKYPIHFSGTGIKQYILIETVFMTKSYPVEVKSVTSMIYEFWKEINDDHAIKSYDMEPFCIKVQTLERTFIDKVFAICDYSVSNNISGHSRHIYDIYKLLKVITINNKLKKLIESVREERKNNALCYTAQDQYNINLLLEDIINKKTYYKDYQEVTKKVLFEDVTYEEAISSIRKIIDSNIFINKL